MQKNCYNCGSQMPRNAKFCGVCGAEFNINIIAQPHNSKTRLTNAIIDKDIHNQKHSVWEYLGQLLLLGLMFLVLALGRPGIMLLSIPWVINVIRMIRDDIRRSRLKYYVLERTCLEKKFVQGDDNPDTWQLWFENRNRDLYVAISVEQSFYDATEIGEEFFVVFLAQDKTPCLCYKKSEWAQ